MKSCIVCACPLSRGNQTGFCRSCGIATRNRDAAFIAKQIAARTMTPARSAAIRKVCEGNRVSLAEKFARYATIETDAGCIEWSGSRDRKGYGQTNLNGRPLIATHAALILDGKPRPSPDHFALHRCDNPSCVNAEHLWWGTQAENIQDAMAKGRVHEQGLRIGREARRKKIAEVRRAA